MDTFSAGDDDGYAVVLDFFPDNLLHLFVVFLQGHYDADVFGSYTDAGADGFQTSGAGRILSSGHGGGFVVGDDDGDVGVFVDAIQQSRHARVGEGGVADDGYGRNEYIETTRPLVVVTAPGPGSGKLATCLSQLYHEHQRGIDAGYAKYETFPIWNLPLNHPVNIAYEAATVDLDDANIIDPFHLEAYGETTVNYNRDVEAFPVLKAMMERIMGESPYQSPTDMGVNMAGYAIVDDDACRDAARLEIVRRYFAAAVHLKRTGTGEEQVERLRSIMNRAGVTPDLSPARAVALEKEAATGAPAGAMVLPDGTLVTGKTSELLGAASSLLLNALKVVAGIDDSTYIVSDAALEPICHLKTEHMHSINPRLHSDETLIALSISSATDPLAEKAIDATEALRGCDAYFSVIISSTDEKTYAKLGINVCCEPVFERRAYYHR